MRNYCSLADHNYLPQLIALYESLVRNSSEQFTLYVVPMDDECERTLRCINLPHVFIVDYKWFEAAMQLETARATRTHAEYCWTCASNLTEFVMRRAELPEITYLDADLFVFSDPAPVFKEIGTRSIAITPHRLIPSKRHLEANGKFNVGFVHFKNTYFGRECLSNWAADCRERCSADVGCGDQKYLDVWPGKYGSEVCIIENIGVNAGPWSLANWTVTEGPRLDGIPLVVFHYHEYAHGQRLTNYHVRPEDMVIYDPYIAAIERAMTQIAAALDGIDRESSHMESRTVRPNLSAKESLLHE